MNERARRQLKTKEGASLSPGPRRLVGWVAPRVIKMGRVYFSGQLFFLRLNPFFQVFSDELVFIFYLHKGFAKFFLLIGSARCTR